MLMMMIVMTFKMMIVMTIKMMMMMGVRVVVNDDDDGYVYY
jgi:hypothetical protein